MRFLVKDGRLIPIRGKENSLPISQIQTIPQPLLNPNFPFNPDLQTLLSGKQLILNNLPHTLEEIQTHYENGYVTYRKGIEYNRNHPICSRCGNKEAIGLHSFPARSAENDAYIAVNA